MQPREQRQRTILVGIAVVVAGAIGAFVLTMSMTTSYPSHAAPASLSRPALERVHDERAGAQRPSAARGSVMIDDGEAPRSPGRVGTLAKEDVRAGVEAVKGRVKDCYQRGLAIDPALAGVVKVAFTLEGNDEGKGVVTKGEIAESDMNSPFFEACVLKEIAGAAFTAPGGGGVVNVSYPFRFENIDDAGP